MTVVPMQVRSPAPRDIWRALLEADEDARVYQTPEWLDAACAVTGGRDLSRLYEWSDGTRAVLPLAGGSMKVESMPGGWGTGGLIAPEPVGPREFEQVIDDLGNTGAWVTRIRPVPDQAGRWKSAAPPSAIRIAHTTHVLSLDGGFAAVERDRFSKSTRRNYRKAARDGITVESGSSAALVDAFYDLYLAWTDSRARRRHLPIAPMRALARRREPKQKIAEVVHRLGSAARVWVASDDGRPVAAAISLRHRRHAVHWRATSDLATPASKYANILINRMLIEAACDSGATEIDLGESGGVRSLIEYKERFGALPVTYDELRLERAPLSTLETWRGALRNSAGRLLPT